MYRMTEYYVNYMFPPLLTGGCGGMPVHLTKHEQNSKTMEGGGSQFVVPGGLVCIQRATNNSSTNAIGCLSDDTISDARFEQLLKRVAEPLPSLFTNVLNVDNSAGKKSKSLKSKKSNIVSIKTRSSKK